MRLIQIIISTHANHRDSAGDLFIVPFSSTGQQKLVVFKEVAEQVGLRFQHYNGMTGKFYLPEITGSGGALFDFDNDGDLDVFLVQGNVLEPNTNRRHAVSVARTRVAARPALPKRIFLQRDPDTSHSLM